MKHIFRLLLFALLISANTYGQKMVTRNGHIWFYSKAPLEDIEAHNYQVTSILDLETGEMAFSLPIKGFKFEKALMEEHFNEKYLHSDKFPKSVFEGKIRNFEKIDLKIDNVYHVKVIGKLTLHGITKEKEIDGILEVKAGKLIGKSKFPIVLSDYDISIPTVVKDNIAKMVDVTVDVVYEPYMKK